MGLSTWVWLIILVVGWLIKQYQKSAKNGVPPASTPRTDSDYDQETGKKPMTFEELLREIQASKTPPQPAQPVVKLPQHKPAKSYEVDYDDDLEDEEKDLETIPSYNEKQRSYEADTRSYELYEKAKSEAFNRPSLEETMKLQDTVMKYSHFKGYDDEKKRSVAKEVLEDFKDPEGFRKAFIMSEILKRKF